MVRRLVRVILAVLMIGSCAIDTEPLVPSPTTRLETPESLDTPESREAVVERVIDGDTIVVDDGERVRLIGMDTPETVKPGSPVECFGKAASRRLTELLPVGTPVRLVADIEPFDRYDRTLSYVYRSRDGLFLNAAMVADGFAYAYTVPPNVAHAEEFARLQSEAESGNRGLWAACPPQT